MRCDDVIRELAVPSDGRDDRAWPSTWLSARPALAGQSVLPRSIGSGMRRVRSIRHQMSGTACGRRCMHNSIEGFRQYRGSSEGQSFLRHPADAGGALGWWQPLVWPRRPAFSWR